MVIFNDDPNTPLNKKIAEILKARLDADDVVITEICRQIYDIGHADGQQYVWDLRAGNFHSIDEIGGEYEKNTSN